MKLAREIIDQTIKLRRHFHQNPELGMEEYETSKKVAEILEELGLTVKKNIANTGVMGFLEGSKPGNTVLLRADMDALPIQDEKNVPYSSKVSNKMHACGHDAHTAILLGVARVLAQNRENLAGNVKFIFQPAEETVGGADAMIKEGVLEEFADTDYALALHMDTDQPTGNVSLAMGASNASSDMLSIELKGKGTHGAYPQDGIDVILMAGQFINNIQGIVSRNISAAETAVLTMGKIEGGQAGNVIPEKVKLDGILRTLNKETRDLIMDKIEDHLDGLVKIHGGDYELEVIPGYPSLINDSNIADLIQNKGQEVLGEGSVEIFETPNMGVEDFAYFLQKVPGAMWYLGCGNEEKGIVYPGHNPKFDIDEDALEIGIRMQVELTMELLEY